MRWYHRLYYRYIRPWLINDNVVKPRWLSRKDCIDCDMLLEYSCFEILARFIEKELIPLRTYKGQVPEYCKEEKQLLEIYRWWKEDCLVKQEQEEDAIWQEIQERFDPQHIFVDDPNHPGWYVMDTKIKEGTMKEEYHTLLKKWHNISEQYKKQLTDNLHKLINLRGCMWT